jgi:serine/threonine-protein kinase
VAEAIALIEPAARALAVAHAQKIAHRDVKPANLFVTAVGGTRTLKVLDFGIAKVLTEHSSFTEALAATRAGPTAFTPRYGAPEQFNKQRGATGPWTDVFALGLIFVEMVSGRKALEGDDPTELYIIAADPSMRPTPRARGAEVPEAVERVIARALSVEPKHRFADAGAFWEALSAAVGQDAGKGMPVRTSSAPSLAKGSTQDDVSMLGTAEFAEQQQLQVKTEPGAPPLDPPALANTEPATSLGGPPLPAQRVSAPSVPPTITTAATSTPEVKGVQRALPTRDPMAETPLGERVSAPVAPPPPPLAEGAKGPAAADPASTSAQPATDEAAAAAPAEAKSRPVWPWLVLALLVGGGALGYTLFTMGSVPDKPVRTSPSAKASSSAKPGPSGAPSARASASASVDMDAGAADAAAEASVPFVQPRDMTWIPPGSARLGEGADARQVALTHGAYIDQMEVTVQQYKLCVAAGKCPSASQVVLPPESAQVVMKAMSDPDDAPQDAKEFARAWTSKCNEPRDAADNPINCVTYAAAQAYCAFRGRRLPTEAEWEMAARGTAGRAFPWGDDKPVCNRACYDRNGGCLESAEGVTTCPAGGRPRDRTPDGVYDLGGNVAEWVADGYASPAPAGNDPMGPTSVPLRVVRGGSFAEPADHVRGTFRVGLSPETASVTIGFRCAMDGPAPQ